ncbi:MerR family transcriptional regulator [Geomicrobium sediminis]|uniref:DNA-binding transcriptional MerR regulator n=1 Tax=Geomicrobium sediminis TaxID=1347788 RepID=A0ABS2PCV0_9BACL|nr:MerR family transcriptional regulator [Geomicrobium sediminis]MBM7633258.1 DNA-binding transcriptional MerR regulator [Geomicrobium sediminis]
MLTIGNLSKKTGVTVRTLGYYDQIGLLAPASRTEGGHRLYDAAQIIRLEQIVSLKYLGFSLDEIKLMIEDGTESIYNSLEKQLQLVREQKAELQRVEQALESMHHSIRTDEEMNWTLLFQVMRLFQQDQRELKQRLDRYLNEEQTQHMLTANLDHERRAEWLKLIADVKKHVNEPPHSVMAQQLATRWVEQVHRMFGSDEAFLENAWEAVREEADGVMFYPMTKEVATFIQKAIEYKENHQLLE